MGASISVTVILLRSLLFYLLRLLLSKILFLPPAGVIWRVVHSRRSKRSPWRIFRPAPGPAEPCVAGPSSLCLALSTPELQSVTGEASLARGKTSVRLCWWERSRLLSALPSSSGEARWALSAERPVPFQKGERGKGTAILVLTSLASPRSSCPALRAWESLSL